MRGARAIGVRVGGGGLAPWLNAPPTLRVQGYALPEGTSIWPVVQRFQDAGLGAPVQWGRWGVEEHPGSGCYVYCDSQASLGVTVEILGAGSGCDSLPAQPPTTA